MVNSGSFLAGSIDDVRPFDHSLTAAEVLKLYGEVAFSMDFNLSNSWQDTSGHGASVTCTSAYCPSVSSGAASFNGAQYLTASGAGLNLTQGAVISDPLPAEIVNASYVSAGATITPTLASPPFTWEVGDLLPGAGGVITVTGVVDPAITVPAFITNTAIITAPLEAWPDDNAASIALPVQTP